MQLSITHKPFNKIFSLLVFTLIFLGCTNKTKTNTSTKNELETLNSDLSQPELYFYKDTENKGISKNFVTDFGGNSTDFNLDDSATLQKAINTLSASGGGSLDIPKGNYTLAEIDLKSNIHLKISDQAIIRPPKNIEGQYAIFKVKNSKTKQPIENVSIIGVGGGYFTVDLRHTNNKRLRVIQSWNVKNFKYSNMLVEDDYSMFAAIEFNGVKVGKLIYGPTYGVVENMKVNNADYGYGLVQLQLGSYIYFNNLDGIGGTTLRIETHNAVLRDVGAYLPPTEIYGRNIRSEKGNSAVMLSPHFINCGIVDIRNITSYGSGFAVRVEKGFTASYEAEVGLTAGSFDSKSIIRNVTATYASGNAQLKRKHFKYMPCSLRPLIDTNPIPPNNVSYLGPSIAGLVNNANYKIDVSENDVTGIGFINEWNFVDDSNIVEVGKCSNE